MLRNSDIKSHSQKKERRHSGKYVCYLLVVFNYLYLYDRVRTLLEVLCNQACGLPQLINIVSMHLDCRQIEAEDEHQCRGINDLSILLFCALR